MQEQKPNFLDSLVPNKSSSLTFKVGFWLASAISVAFIAYVLYLYYFTPPQR